MLGPVRLFVIVVLAAIAAIPLPGAGASPSPPAPPAEATPPGDPTDPPESKPASFRATEARLKGRKVTIGLSCKRSGRVELSVLGRGAKPVGSSPFACKRGRAKVTVTVATRVARMGRSHKALNLVATVVAGGHRVKLPVPLRDANEGSGAAQYRAVSDWNVPAAWCVPPRIVMSVHPTTRFSVNYGDEVWWHPIVHEYDYRLKRWIWNTNSAWDKYRVDVPDGMFFYNQNTGMIIFPSYAQTRAMSIVATRGRFAKPAIQVWTYQRGYEWKYVTAAMQYGYGEQYADGCYIPTTA